MSFNAGDVNSQQGQIQKADTFSFKMPIFRTSSKVFDFCGSKALMLLTKLSLTVKARKIVVREWGIPIAIKLK